MHGQQYIKTFGSIRSGRMNMADFWDVTLCQMINTNDSGENFVSCFYSEDGVNGFSKKHPVALSEYRVK